MKYIIMCGGYYSHWNTPKHLSMINGEPIVARTIRLLKEQGIADISISSNNPIFEQFGVPVLKHTNNYGKKGGLWSEAFYPLDEPCTYLFGDVVFSPEAIKTIIDTETDDIEFFASAKPFAENYIKPYKEPFAFKVVNQEHLKQAQKDCRKEFEAGHFKRKVPLSWEFWQVVKKTPLNQEIMNYVPIQDYTCDIDKPEDVVKFNKEVFKLQ